MLPRHHYSYITGRFELCRVKGTCPDGEILYPKVRADSITEATEKTWTADPGEYRDLSEKAIEKAIEEDYGIDLFYLLDEETATIVSDQIAGNPNGELNNPTPKGLKALLESWRETENRHGYTSEQIMEVWKKHHY